MKLSSLQKEIVTSNHRDIIVMASAASGKTRCLTERVKYLLEQGVEPSSIVMFTFTNAAAEEMRARIGDKGKDIFINTIHSYAFNLLLKYGIDVTKLANEERFDEFFELVEHNPGCIEKVDYLLLDEAQDSNMLQFKFILDMIKPAHTFIVGDLRQSIYGWSGSKPEVFLDLIESGRFKIYSLNENYRNGPSILRFAKKIIGANIFKGCDLTDDSICMREFDADMICEVGFSRAELVNRINGVGEYRDWFVLTRSNEQITIIMDILGQYNIPCDSFKRGQLTNDEFRERMQANTVKVLTVHASKGLEADNVIVYGVPKWSQKDEERRVAYVAATRAKKQLIWFKQSETKQKKKVFKTSNWE